MAITIDDVSRGLTEAGLKFKQADDTHIVLGFGTDHGRVGILIALEEDGKYLDSGTLQYKCTADHPNFQKVAEVMNDVNYQKRLLRAGWDPEDGEIALRSSILLEDNNVVTATQVGALIAALMVGCEEITEKIEPLLKGKGGSSKPSKLSKPDKPSKADKPAKPEKSGNPALMVLAIGVLLLGLAAAAGVVYYFFFFQQ